MNLFKKGLIILILPLLAFTSAHKFYVSVTNITHSEKDQAIQITSRLFIDDIEKAMEERYGMDSKLSTAEESVLANEYIEKYFNTKFLIYLNGEKRSYNFLGKKYDNDVVICYLEIPEVQLEQTKTIEVQNELLTDLFDEQQNVVHFKIDGKKKSFVLIRENNKGMLKL